MAGDRYQTFRSFSDLHVSVLCYEGSFYDAVPQMFASRARGRETVEVPSRQ